MRFPYTVACVAILLTAAPCVARAQRVSGALPRAAEIIARYDKALGGVAAIHRHKSATFRGVVEVRKPDATMKVRYVMYMRAPYFQLGKFTLPDSTGEVLNGFDGTNAWHLAPGAQPEIFTGDDRESIKRDADFYYAVTELSWFKSMETVGIEDFEGHSCYHLHGTTNWGVSNNQFYDRETGLLVGYEFDNTWQGAPALDHEVFSDYRKVDGVLTSMVQTSKAKPKRDDGEWTIVQVMTKTSVAFNNVDSSTFIPPQSVRDLLAKK